MDQWSTPIKNESKCDFMRSPITYKTPVKQDEMVSRCAAYQSNVNCFRVLPSHITPPSGLTKFIARNPFETDLINKLHMSVISPTVFNKVLSPARQSPDFAWTVDELAQLRPVKIEEFPMQQIDCTDPETEMKVQAAIDKFFKTNQIIVSPWDIKRKENGVNTEVDTPTRPSENLNSSSSKSKKDASSQTVLTFPSKLPSHIVEVLNSYFTFTQDQNVENDDENSNNNSLRRKLFFDQDDCAESEGNNTACLSPVKMNESLILSSSPPQSGMLVHGTPLKHLSNANYDRDTSQTVLGSISPPNISPIQSTMSNMSCESMKSRSRSIARLDFTTEMSIDYTHSQHKQCLENQFLDESHDKDNIRMNESKTDSSMTSDSNSTCVRSNTFAGAKVASRISSQFEIGSPGSNFKQEIDVEALKRLAESCKVFANDSCILQQTNGMFTSDQQSASNFTQDTGYQTYSMSSMTNVMDSCMITPVKEKTCWGDRAPFTDDEFRVSDWKENMRNVFSSTPSRSNTERENLIH